jgi:uncharacterized membrane protein YidH (DUF202 family)
VSAYEPESRDPGLAGERTDLAWNRSGLSLVACGAVLLRGLSRSPLRPSALGVGVSILCLGAVVEALGAWYSRRARTHGRRPAVASDLLPVSIGVGLVGTAAFVLAAVFPR